MANRCNKNGFVSNLPCASATATAGQLFVLGRTFAVSWADCEENENNPFAKEGAEQTWTAEGRNGSTNCLVGNF